MRKPSRVPAEGEENSSFFVAAQHAPVIEEAAGIGVVGCFDSRTAAGIDVIGRLSHAIARAAVRATVGV